MKVIRWLDRHLEGSILTAMLTLLATLVLVQIVMRYLVGNSLTWSEELCRMLLVWSGFFTIGYCVRKGSTIRLETLVVLLPRVIQRVLLVLTSLFMTGLLAYLTRGAWALVVSTRATGSLMAGMDIPLYILYVGPLVGLALGVLRTVQVLVTTRGFRELGKKKEEVES